MELTNFAKGTQPNPSNNSNANPGGSSASPSNGNSVAPTQPKSGETSGKLGDELGLGIIDNILGRQENYDLHTIHEVPLNISVVLGETRIKVKDLLNLSVGSVIELNRKVGDYVDIQANNITIAKGEIVMVDGKVGVSIVEMVKTHT